MKSVGYHRLAENELIRSAVFYERRRRFLGEQFLAAVEEAVATLRRNPSSSFGNRQSAFHYTFSSFPLRLDRYAASSNSTERIATSPGELFSFVRPRISSMN